MKKPQPPFGQALDAFVSKTGVSKREIQKYLDTHGHPGFSYQMILDTSIGRCAGYKIVPAVTGFMEAFDAGSITKEDVKDAVKQYNELHPDQKRA